MKKLGKSLSDKELEDMMKQAYIDADSHISAIFQGCHEEVRRILIRQRIRTFIFLTYFRVAMKKLGKSLSD